MLKIWFFWRPFVPMLWSVLYKVLITDTDIGLSLKVPLTHRPTGRATGHTLNHRQLITISLATAAATANRSNYTHLCLSSYATLYNVFYWRTWTWAMFSSFFWVLSTFITLSMAKGRAKKITYPCPVCDKSCGGGTIHCARCDMWVHPACVPLTDAEFEEYGRPEDYFLCPRCVSTSEDDVGIFDISKCLLRYVLIILLKQQSYKQCASSPQRFTKDGVNCGT